MNRKKKVGIGCLGIILLLVAGAVAIWIWKPWVPPVEFVDPGPSGQRIEQDELLGNYYPASGNEKQPAILLLGGSEGGLTSGSDAAAKLLQEHGYSVLYLSYFRSPGQSEKLEMIPIEYFDKALAWLGKQPNVDPDRIGVMGGSKGAEAALILASRHPKLAAVVASMPSNVVWQGFDWNNMFDPSGLSSTWSLNGEPLPYVRYGEFDYEQGTVSLYSSGLNNLPEDSPAYIPIERSDAPILLVCGELDNLWPSCPMARAAKERADDAGKTDVTILAYADAGHGVAGRPRSDDDESLEGLAAFGGTGQGNNNARKDNWPKTLAFFDDHLMEGDESSE